MTSYRKTMTPQFAARLCLDQRTTEGLANLLLSCIDLRFSEDGESVVHRVNVAGGDDGGPPYGLHVGIDPNVEDQAEEIADFLVEVSLAYLELADERLFVLININLHCYVQRVIRG